MSTLGVARSLILGVAALSAAAAFIEPRAARAAAQDSNDEISAQAEQPTAPLRTVELNDWYNATLHDRDGSINQVIFRAILPFAVDDTHHWVRITMPETTAAPNGKTGLGDTEVVELKTLEESWGRFGMGGVVQVPTGDANVSSNQWSIGPALGMSNDSNPKYRWGFLLRTYWSVAGDGSAKSVGIVNFQPNFTLSLGAGRTLSLGQTRLVYDTEASRWKSLQAGVKFGGLSRTNTSSGIRWKPTFEADYDFCNQTGNPAWTMRAGITMLLPPR